MKRTLPLLLLGLILFSCNTDDDGVSSQSQHSKLREIKVTNITRYGDNVGSTEITTDFTYENGKLTRVFEPADALFRTNFPYIDAISPIYKVAYEFNEEGNIDIQRSTYRNDYKIKWDSKYTYEEGLLTKIENIPFHIPLINKSKTFSFEYNNQKQLIKKKYTLVEDGNVTDHQTYMTYEYNTEGNLAKKSLYVKDTLNTFYTFSDYDDFKNPYSEVFKDSYFKVFMLSINNPRKIIKTVVNGPGQYYRLDYIYNEDGFPTQSIKYNSIKEEAVQEKSYVYFNN